jgi:hypothetical protein
MGMVLGNSKLHSLKELLYFKESLSVLLISILFILLAANMNLEDLMLLYTWKTAILFALIVFVIRPLAVFVSARGSTLKLNEKLPPCAGYLFANINPIPCFGDSTNATIQVYSGGTEPYNYLWNTGHTDSVIYNITAGTYSDEADIDVVIEKGRFAEVKKILTDLRNTPSVWIAEDNTEGTIIYGYYREFDVLLTGPVVSMCTLSIEGLT